MAELMGGGFMLLFLITFYPALARIEPWNTICAISMVDGNKRFNTSGRGVRYDWEDE